VLQGEKVLQEFVESVRKRFGERIKRIILYGSYARGDYGDDSDIDVLVVGDVTLDELIEVSFPLLLKYGVYVSPHVMTDEHFNYLYREGYSFIKNVKKEGRTIHA